MRGLVAAVIAGFALSVPPALAESPQPEPVGRAAFCRPGKTGPTCAGVTLAKHRLRVILFKYVDLDRGGPKRIPNISYRACSTAPSGKTKCIPRTTHATSVYPSGYVATYDQFFSPRPSRTASPASTS